MRHASTQELYRYWNRQRGEAPAAKRSAVEPADIRTLLGDTFILDTSSGTEAPFRLAGTRLCELYGAEMKGRDFRSLFTGADREAVETLIASIATDAAAAVLGLTGETERGDRLPLEMVLLPLSSAGAGYDRILGLLVALESPYWAGLRPLTRLGVTSVRLLWPDERPAFLAAPPAARPQTQPSPAAAELRRARLIVLEGGKR
ncbi:PAS domain-containing protein [Prosthecomicrobium pneumaticum]|uniref:PAS domain-containing protein n=1 Tax=Prosthecomicrobium pneumaticum TaxID=81895 RepID=A0A7W9FPC2_9HYPH|nr:PAS domain-containing protein [Prosthecomicrobium pneumaticum]MBB5754414.1 hypothetical protein [Prosthecomicrobium pneumaticum]